MVTRTEAIKNFLNKMTHCDLAKLYNHNMECQVNVAQDGGEPVVGEYQGRKWKAWTDNVTTWKPFRIPYNANKVPEYDDRPMSFDLAVHAEAIGLTGWDWVARRSKWVAFDFDHIASHGGEKALSREELDDVIKVAMTVSWVTVRRSTSGTGVHLYVTLPNVPTQNHNEHAALARAILGKLAAATGYDFSSKVDICGGNMWVWHRKMDLSEAGNHGLELVHQGDILKAIPSNWRDHLSVVQSKRNRIMPNQIIESNTTSAFDELCGQRPRTPLEESHRALMNHLEESGAVWWWDSDNHMLVTHTLHLKEAHQEMMLRGFFDTTSSHSTEHNCFCYPLRGGGWAVRRYSLGVEEHPFWEQDPGGWTRCYLNRSPTFDSACRAYEGLEDPSGGYIFRDVVSAAKAAELLGVFIKVGTPQERRSCKLKRHKDGRIIVEVDHDSRDRGDEMGAWLQKKDHWVRLYNPIQQDSSQLEPETTSLEDTVRHLVTETGEDYGWMIRADDIWRKEPLAHVKIALTSLGMATKDINNILGSSIFHCWTLVNKPFQDEYPGNKQWNRNAAQFRFTPSQGDNHQTKHWDMILNHIGSCLDDALKDNIWAKANGITRGSDYLRCWIASLFQQPLAPLPYLFLYGDQNSGKSILHEALSRLLTKGYVFADQCLVNTQGFNGELEGAIVCVVEEVDIGKSNTAYNRIKDWVTAREISIHQKGGTPFHMPNSTHWIQTANDASYCPVFPGDTRITMLYVPDLDPLELIPKGQLITRLEEEAPDFIASVMQLELPASNDRLNVPVITTEDKSVMQQINQSPIKSFMSSKTKQMDGHWIKFSDFYDKLVEWIDADEFHKHTKKYVAANIPPQYPRGRSPMDNQLYIGNIIWINNEGAEPDGKYVVRGTQLVKHVSEARP